VTTKYDKRVDQLEARLTQSGKLPPHACGPFIQWLSSPDEKPDFSAIEARLMAEYGTTRGAKFLALRWGFRDSGDVPGSDEVSGNPL